MITRPRIALAVAAVTGAVVAAALGLGAHGASGQAVQGPEFADWTRGERERRDRHHPRPLGLAVGVERGCPTRERGGRHVDRVQRAAVLAHRWRPATSSTSPGFAGYSYTLAFGAPTRDPVLHVANLASTLAFPGGHQHHEAQRGGFVHGLGQLGGRSPGRQQRRQRNRAARRRLRVDLLLGDAGLYAPE